MDTVMAKARNATSHNAASPRRKPPLDPAGRELLAVEARGSFGRVTTMARAKPGGFDWLAARRRLTGGQEQVGMRLRAIWEATGGREPGSPTWDAGGTRSGLHGPSEGVLEAYEDADHVARMLGQRFGHRVARLRAFLLDDLSEQDMALRWNMPLRMMRRLIRQDLDFAARKLGY